MKTRNGFVSNSSSSSFIILFDNEIYKKVYDTSSELLKKVMDEFGFSAEIGNSEIFGLSYGVDLCGDETSYILEDLVGDKKELLEDGTEIDSCNILEIIEEKLINESKSVNKKYFSRYEGRG